MTSNVNKKNIIKKISKKNLKENIESKTDANNYIDAFETFNYTALQAIINNKKKFKSQLRKSCFKGKYDPFLLAEKYLNKSSFGKIHVKYVQKEGKGRYWAIEQLSMQSMCREIRHTIANENYVDIDIENCHPVILNHLCEKFNFVKTNLNYYVNNRDQCLKDLKVPKEQAKKVYLSLINGGKSDFNNLTYKNDFVLNFKDEMEKIHNSFSLIFREEFDKFTTLKHSKGISYNIKASFMNTLLCDFENNILMNIYDFYENPANCVLCFDGIMLLKKDYYNLRDCENNIFDNLGIKIKLKIKEMNQPIIFENTEEVKPTKEQIDEKLCFEATCKKVLKDIMNDNITDHSVAETFYEISKNTINIIDDDGNGYMWNNHKKLWEYKTSNQLMVQISSDKNILSLALNEIINDLKKLPDQIKTKMFKSRNAYIKKIKNSSGIKSIFTFLKIFLRNDNFTKTINREHDLLPIQNNKIINLINGQISDRTKDNLFSSSCPVSYIPQCEWTEEDTANHNTFIHQIFMENSKYIEYMQIKMGSYLSGQNTRNIDINMGIGKNGKSSIINALQTILGDFFGFIAKNVVVYNPKSFRTKNGGHTSHLIPIENKRLIVTQELEDGDVIDSEIVKKIASNDPIEGIREAYGKQTRVIYPFCKLVISSNNAPEWDGQDVAIIDRLTFHPFNARFLTANEIDSDKKRGIFDESRYSYFEANKKIINIYKTEGRQINILFSWLVDGCVKFYKTIDEGISKPIIVEKFIWDKIYKNDPVGRWIEENCDVYNAMDFKKLKSHERTNYMGYGNDLYCDYKQWVIDEGDSTLKRKKQKFFLILQGRFKKVRRANGFFFQRIYLKDISD